jgi:hypothetical protein
MDKMTEIEKQLNRMFQFMFKEDKKYVFIENDVKGLIDVNVADEKAFRFIVQDKQRFLSLVNDYLDIHDVRVRKYNGTLPDLTERPQLLKQEVIVTKHIKQKVFVVKKKTLTKVITKTEADNDIFKIIEELKSKLFKMRDEAWDRHKKSPSKHEDYFLYGTYLTVAETYHYIKQMEGILYSSSKNSKELTEAKINTIKQIEEFIFNEFEKLWEEQKKYFNDENYLQNAVYISNFGQIQFIATLYSYLKTINDYDDE